MINLEIKTKGLMTEAQAKELFDIEFQDNTCFESFILENYLPPEEHWRFKTGDDFEELAYETFDWLYDRYPEEMLINPIQMAYEHIKNN